MPAQGKKSLPIDEDVHQAIAVKSKQLPRTMQKLIREAWALWEEKHTSGKSPATDLVRNVPERTPKADPLSDKILKHRVWVTRLLEILDSGDREAVSAVQQNISVFYDFVALKKRRQTGSDLKNAGEK